LADFRLIEASLLDGRVNRPGMLEGVRDAIEGLITFLSVDWLTSTDGETVNYQKSEPPRTHGAGPNFKPAEGDHEKVARIPALSWSDLEASDTDDGCPICRSSSRARERVSEELIGRLIERIHYDRTRYSGVFYENAFITRCPECGTLWLEQYWELETPETTLAEWGGETLGLTPPQCRRLSHAEGV
jgi:hypothetical protein